MKSRIIYFFIIAFNFGFALKAIAQEDLTLVLSDKSIADQPNTCLTLYIEEQANITSFNILITYDEQKLTYAAWNNRVIEDMEITELTPGQVLIQRTSTSSVAVGAHRLVNLCFRPTGATSDIEMSQVLFAQDVTFVNDADGINYNVIYKDATVTFNNTARCTPPEQCIPGVSVVYDGFDIEIFPADLLEGSLIDFLACKQINIGQLKIANLSADELVIEDRVTLSCGDLKEQVYVALFLDDDVSFGPVFSFCKVPIFVANLENYTSCVKPGLSKYEPGNCQDISVTASGDEVVIDYEQLTGIPMDPTTLYFITTGELGGFPRINYDVADGPASAALPCSELAEVNTYDLKFIVDNAITPQRIIVLDDWCTASLTISNWDETCGFVSTGDNEATVNVLNDEEQGLQLNGTLLGRRTARSYGLNLADLVEGENVIDVIEGGDGLDGLSTLDLVMIYRGLVLENFEPAMAIASDLDFSGSPTTKDLFLLRKRILGIIQDDISKYFLIKKDHDFSDFDMLDFGFDFSKYPFNSDDLSDGDVLEFEVFKYGNVSDAKSDFHKSDETNSAPSFLQLENVKVLSDETFTTEVTLIANKGSLTAGAGWKFDHKSLELIEVDGDFGGAELLWHKGAMSTTFSYLPGQAVEDVRIKLTFRARQSGKLSELLALSDDYRSERVSDDLRASPITLDFQDANIDAVDFSVFPNPASEILRIVGPSDSETYQLTIYAMTGEQILSQSFQTSIELSLDKLETAGLYILEISDGVTSYFEKIMLD